MKYPQVGALILKTRNLKKTVEFYRTLGVPLEEERHEEGPLHFACELGNIHFAVYEEKEADLSVNCSLMVGLSVEDLKSTMERLKKESVRFLHELEERPWGPRAVVFDPDGRHVEIWQPRV